MSIQQQLHYSIPRLGACLFALAACSGAAHADWGDLDLSYGSGGMAFIDIGADTADSAFAAAADSAGNLYIAGGSTPSGSATSGLAIAKLDANGHAVGAFGAGGHVFSDLVPNLNDRATAMTVGADGSLYIAGIYPRSASSSDFFVAKLDSGGHFANGFGVGGVATIDVGSGTHDVAHAIAVDSGGHVYVAGVSNDGTGESAAIVKLDAGGQSMASFGGDGRVVLDLDWPTNADALAFDAQGHLVVAGSLIDNDSAPYLVVKLDANGNFVSGFGDDGVALAATAGGYEYCVGVALDGAGNIYVGGTVRIGTETDFSAAKIDADGTPDGDFGDGGLAVVNLGFDLLHSANAMTMDREGHLLLGGFVNTGTDYQYAVAALDADGSPAFDFGDNGQRVFHLGSADFDVATALAIDPRTRGPLVVGYSTADSGTNHADFSVTRLQAGPQPDPIYSSGFE